MMQAKHMTCARELLFWLLKIVQDGMRIQLSADP
jgi:hypothetical protein